MKRNESHYMLKATYTGIFQENKNKESKNIDRGKGRRRKRSL